MFLACHYKNYGRLIIVSLPFEYLVYRIPLFLLTPSPALYASAQGLFIGPYGIRVVLRGYIRCVVLSFVLDIEAVWQVTLHQFYLRHREFAPVCPVPLLQKSEEETPYPSVARELLDES